MTIYASDGPAITIGIEQPLGVANQPVGVAGVGPYISGTAENPDAGPNCFFGANMLKDPLYRYQRGRGPTVAGGYPNQALGFIDHFFQTVDFAPSAIATANIAVGAHAVSGVPMVLVSATGAGITVVTTNTVVQNSGLVVPGSVAAPALLIDNAPTWASVSFASGAMRAFDCTACGRVVSITGVLAGSGGHFIVKGYDLYGRPQTENINATAAATTTNGLKGWKWITSVTPQFSDANNYSVGTADIFEFPIRADKLAQVRVFWNNILGTVTGFTAADLTAPSPTTGSVRGTYALQTTPSNGTIQLQIQQVASRANIAGSNYLTGLFGNVPA